MYQKFVCPDDNEKRRAPFPCRIFEGTKFKNSSWSLHTEMLTSLTLQTCNYISVRKAFCLLACVVAYTCLENGWTWRRDVFYVEPRRRSCQGKFGARNLSDSSTYVSSSRRDKQTMPPRPLWAEIKARNASRSHVASLRQILLLTGIREM